MNQQVCPKKRLVKLLAFSLLLWLFKYLSLTAVPFFRMYKGPITGHFLIRYIFFSNQVSVCWILLNASARDSISAPVQLLHQVFLFLYTYAELKNMYFFFFIIIFLFKNKKSLLLFWFLEQIYVCNIISQSYFQTVTMVIKCHTTLCFSSHC